MLNEAVNRATTEETEGANTPQKVVHLVRQVGPIALDPCSNAGSLVNADRAVCLPEDGLAVNWYESTRWKAGYPHDAAPSSKAALGIAYVNPPYGRKMSAWIEKCIQEANRGTEIISLLPARPGSRWFQQVFHTAQAICFWAGRLRFEGAPASAPFDSALAYYGTRQDRFREVFGAHGTVVLL